MKIVFLAIALTLCTFLVWLLSGNRQELQDSVENQIASQWGGVQKIYGPVMINETDSLPPLLPESFRGEAKVETRSLHRGIYDVEVYDANVSLEGVFNCKDFNLKKDTALITVELKSYCVTGESSLMWNGKKYAWRKTDKGLEAEVKLDSVNPGGNYKFSTNIPIKGAKGLYIGQPAGKNSTILINGKAANPSFQGSTLPDSRAVDSDEFNSRWESSMRYSSGMCATGDGEESAVPAEEVYESPTGYVGVNFLSGADTYVRVNRAIKYSFIIIFLTFVGVYGVEIHTKRRLPMLYYTLVGLALVMFYVLLLSIAELFGFGAGYLCASVMTVGLIMTFVYMSLRSRKIMALVGCVLAFMYGFCYVMLSLESYALLMGSIFLFVVLAIVMIIYANSMRQKEISR